MNAIETETAEAQKEAAELSKLQAERSHLAATVQAYEEQLAQGLAALEPVLARADLAPADVERDPAAAERRVRTLADEYANLISVRDDLSEKLRRLDLEQKGCEERYQAASHEHDNAVRGSAVRARQLKASCSSARRCSGGWRRRTSGERAGRGCECPGKNGSGPKAEGYSGTDAGQIGGRASSAVALLARAVERLADARAAFAEAIAGAGLQEAAVHALLAGRKRAGETGGANRNIASDARSSFHRRWRHAAAIWMGFWRPVPTSPRTSSRRTARGSNITVASSKRCRTG